MSKIDEPRLPRLLFWLELRGFSLTLSPIDLTNPVIGWQAQIRAEKPLLTAEARTPYGALALLAEKWDKISPKALRTE